MPQNVDSKNAVDLDGASPPVGTVCSTHRADWRRWTGGGVSLSKPTPLRNFHSQAGPPFLCFICLEGPIPHRDARRHVAAHQYWPWDGPSDPAYQSARRSIPRRDDAVKLLCPRAHARGLRTNHPWRRIHAVKRPQGTTPRWTGQFRHLPGSLTSCRAAKSPSETATRSS
jgi:hypothetical protein